MKLALFMKTLLSAPCIGKLSSVKTGFWNCRFMNGRFYTEGFRRISRSCPISRSRAAKTPPKPPRALKVLYCSLKLVSLRGGSKASLRDTLFG